MTPITIGLIGLGTAGLRHATAVRKTSLGKIVAIADPAPGAVQAVATLDVPLWASYETMMQEANPDAVIISLPHYLLPAAAFAAAAQGKHILLEKPMGHTPDEARQVAQACTQAQVKLMVNFVHRFRAESRQAFDAIRAGAIGKVMLVVDIMASGAGPLPPWIWQRDKSGGGIMMYNGVHSIDRLIWLAGAPVREVTASMATLAYDIPVEDNLVGTLQFENGVLGSIVQHKSQAQVTLGMWQTVVYGTTGALKFVSGEGIEIASEKEVVSATVKQDDRFLGAFQEFAAAIREDRAPVPSGADGVHAMDTAFALYESAESGKRITLHS